VSSGDRRRGVGALLGRLGTVLRDGWLILGLSLVLFVAVEGLFRAQQSLRVALSGGPKVPPAGPLNPNAGQAWWAGWWQQPAFVNRHRYDPYRGWKWEKSYHSPYVNVDSSGSRVTVQPPVRGPNPRRVFVLGGSTVWGFTVRDAFTIPSQLAMRLRRAGIDDVEVVNLAQPGYNVTQGTITLLLRLAQGDVPAAVAFLDGHNDVAAAWWAGQAGAVLGEPELAAIFERRAPGLWATIANAIASRSQLVQRLRGTGADDSVRQRRGSMPPCANVAAHYRSIVRDVETLGRAYGFATAFFWQPLLSTSHKRRTAWERSLHPPPYEDYLVRCEATTDSLMRDQTERQYFPLRTLFDDDTASVFMDYYGHLTEQANGVVADRMAAVLIPLLRRH
jgi:lysophospholipase L1-like esterase